MGDFEKFGNLEITKSLPGECYIDFLRIELKTLAQRLKLFLRQGVFGN